MEEEKHTYIVTPYMELRCYYCKAKWKSEGVYHNYICPTCGKEANGKPQL